MKIFNWIKNIIKKLDEFAEQWQKDYDAMTPEQKAIFWQIQDRLRMP